MTPLTATQPSHCSPSCSKGTLSIRANSGLGDSIYLQSVARWFVEQGHHVEACSAWPDVFRPLGDRVTVSAFRRHPVDRLAAYTLRKGNRSTTQFQDCCIQAGAPRDTPLRLDWTPANWDLVRRIKALAPVVIVPVARAPFDRKDGFGAELLPDCSVIDRAIWLLRDLGVRIVQVGKGKPLFRFTGIDLDLAGETSVSDLIDVAWSADGVLGYVSFMVPLAESLDKPGLFVWSRLGLNSTRDFIAQITPKKILTHGKTVRAVIDDCTDDELDAAVAALRGQIGREAPVHRQAGGDRRIRPERS